MRDSEPKIVRSEYAGGGPIEVVTAGEGPRFAIYTPPTWEFETTDAHAAYIKDSKLGANEAVRFTDYPGHWTEPAVRLVEELPGDSTDKVTIIRVPLKRCPWGLPDSPLVGVKDSTLFEDLRLFISDHCDFMDPRLYDILAAWVLATWICEAWDVVPYVFLLGPKASGKTRVLETLRALSYRGVLGSTISEAALYQCVEYWKTALLLDEVERYNKEKAATVQNLLNSGYRRGQYAIRAKISENGERTLEMFEVYGFKALAGTEGLLASLESRSIIVHMAKSQRRLRFLIDERRAKTIRTRLLAWRWEHLGEVAELHRVFEEDGPAALDFAMGRFVELFSALYAVAPEARTQIITYARDSAEEYDDEEYSSDLAEVLLAVFKVRAKVEKGRVAVADVSAAYNEDRDNRDTLNPTMIGRLLKTLGLKKKRLANTRAGYVWDEALLRSLAKRYGIPEKVSGIRPEDLPPEAQLPGFKAPPVGAPDGSDASDGSQRGVSPKAEPAPAASFDKFEADALRVLVDADGSMGEVLFMRGMKARGHDAATILDRAKDLDARGVVRYNAGRSISLVKKETENDKMSLENGATPQRDAPDEEAP